MVIYFVPNCIFTFDALQIVFLITGVQSITQQTILPCRLLSQCEGDTDRYDVLDFESDKEPEFVNADDLDDEDDIPVSFHNAFILNEVCVNMHISDNIFFTALLFYFQNYQQELRWMIRSLEDSLAENRARQQAIKDDIDAMHVGIPIKRTFQNPVIARNPVTVFYAPYFKDANLYTHPPNSDTILRKQNLELDLYLTNPREMNETERDSLVCAVREDAINKRLKALVEQEKEVLLQMRKAGISQLEKMELRARLRKYIADETDIRNLPDSVLFCDPKEEFDWLKVAAQAFNRTVTPNNCRLMWLNNLHPSINRGRWTKPEDRHLKALVDMPDENGLLRPRKDWDKIAMLLSTNRTAFLCFHRYQMKHNRMHNNRKWIKSEDDRLRELVRKCRINRFVPWTKVAYYMHHRTKDQCYQRYVYSIRDEVRMGFFEENEDHIILIGSKLFGHDWSRISHFIPTRTPMQIHSRYNTFLKANFENWIQNEDVKLLATVKAKGEKDWVSVANEFANRTRSQCRQRFYYIHKWYKKSTNFSLSFLPYTDLDGRQKTKQQELYRKLNEKVDEFLRQNRIKSEDSDEDEDENTIDATFAVEKAASKNFHTTPDGEKIPMKALQDFMMKLSEGLPPAQHDLKKIVRPKVEVLRSKKLNTVGDLVPKGRCPSRMIAPVGSAHLVANKKLEKIFEPAWPVRQNRNKEVYRSERELKIARQIGRLYMMILSADDLMNRGPQLGLPLINAIRKTNECKNQPVLERQKQFLEIIRSHVHPSEEFEMTSVAAPSSKSIKTYSRKSRQTPYFRPVQPEASSSTASTADPYNYLKFVPPNIHTLVGWRALLLSLRKLRKQVADVTTVQPGSSNSILNTTFDDPAFLGLEQYSQRITESRPKAINNDKLTPEEADKRLKERFISMFFWPGVMSSVHPDERRDVFDIEGEEEVVAACDPVDASEIIVEAQTKASVNPKIVQTKKRRSSGKVVPKKVQFETTEENEKEAEVAPPPIKKRILAKEGTMQQQMIVYHMDN